MASINSHAFKLCLTFERVFITTINIFPRIVEKHSLRTLKVLQVNRHRRIKENCRYYTVRLIMHWSACHVAFYQAFSRIIYFSQEDFVSIFLISFVHVRKWSLKSLVTCPQASNMAVPGLKPKWYCGCAPYSKWPSIWFQHCFLD